MISSVGFGCNKLVEFPRMKSSSRALCYNDLMRHVCPEDHSSHLVIPLRNKVLFLSVEEQSPVFLVEMSCCLEVITTSTVEGSLKISAGDSIAKSLRRCVDVVIPSF